jgi:hypothetical protein
MPFTAFDTAKEIDERRQGFRRQLRRRPGHAEEQVAGNDLPIAALDRPRKPVGVRGKR